MLIIILIIVMVVEMEIEMEMVVMEMTRLYVSNNIKYRRGREGISDIYNNN
jgi:hypothetical protein